jgi:hypothetical protein
VAAACAPGRMWNPCRGRAPAAGSAERSSGEHFLLGGAIGLGRVEEGDATVERSPDQADGSVLSVAGPKPIFSPMQPKPKAETSSPLVPSMRVFIDPPSGHAWVDRFHTRVTGHPPCRASVRPPLNRSSYRISIVFYKIGLLCLY